MSETAFPISDPRKNDIFISYSNQDIEFTKKLDAALRYQRRDPWIDWEDVPLHAKTDAERQQYVEAGIKDADVFVSIISPNSISDKRIIAELKLAAEAQKQLIIVSLDQLGEIEIPFLTHCNWLQLFLKKDEVVDFRDITKKVIYAQIHTKLLVRAEEWVRKNYSEDVLLQGRDLVAVQKWASQRLDPIFELQSIQNQYLEASLAAEARLPKHTDSFISYSRQDKEFTEKLYAALRENGLSPWVDWKNIPVATDWWEEIKEGIETAHTFVFVVSPDSIVSPYCHAEIAHAIKHGKRFISVAWREVPQQIWQKLSEHKQEICIRDKPITIDRGRSVTVADAIETLKRFQWHRVQSLDDFSITLQELLDAIQTDLDYVKKHTRLLLRALEWNEQNRSSDLLLRGEDLRLAEQWLASSQGREPHLTLLQEVYIQEGSKAEAAQHREVLLQRARVRSRTNLLINLLLLSVILGISSLSIFAKRQSISTLAATFENPQGSDRLVNALALGSRFQHAKWIALVDPKLQARVVTVLQQQIQNITEFNQLEAHAGTVFNVSFSPDMQQIASASEDGNVGLWSVDGRLIKLLSGHQDAVVSVAFAPTDRVLASGSRDGTIKLWSSEGALLKTLPPPRADQDELPEIISVSFSPGGQRLAAAYQNGMVKLWTPHPSRGWAYAVPVATLRHAQEQAVTSVSFSRYGDRIATAGLDGTVKLWTAQGLPIAANMQHAAPVLSVSFSPDNQLIASADLGGTLKLWTRDEGRELQSISAHEGVIHRVVFAPPDGKIFASVSQDGTIKLWTFNGKLLHTLRGHSAAVYRVQFSPDGRTLASAGADDTVKLWSTYDGALLNTFEGHRDEVLDIDFSSNVDNPILISAGRDRTIRIWNLTNQVTVLQHNNRVFDVSFSPDGKVIASSGNRSIRLWQQNGTPFGYVPDAGAVLSLSFSPHAKVLASGGTDDTIKLWRFDRDSLAQLEVMPAQQGSVLSLDFNTDGRLLASGGEDGTIKLWRFDGTRATVVKTVRGHQGTVSGVRFSPDGKTLASAGADGTLKFWQLDGTLVRSIACEQGKISSLDFSPTGLLASAGQDGTVKLWRSNGALFKILEERERFSDKVLKVRFSHDGKLLASANQDSTVKLWTSRGELVTTLQQHNREVSSVAFSPDAMTLASSGFDNSVRLWQLPDRSDRFAEHPLEGLLSQGCGAAKDYLTSQNFEKKSKVFHEVKAFCGR